MHNVDVQAKVAKFLDMKYTGDQHINSTLLSSTAFANPHIYAKLVCDSLMRAFADLHPRSTSSQSQKQRLLSLRVAGSHAKGLRLNAVHGDRVRSQILRERKRRQSKLRKNADRGQRLRSKRRERRGTSRIGDDVSFFCGQSVTTSHGGLLGCVRAWRDTERGRIYSCAIVAGNVADLFPFLSNLCAGVRTPFFPTSIPTDPPSCHSLF